MENPCPFCLELNGNNQKVLNYGLTTSILYEGKYWFVVPSVGCFVPGYLLVVNKLHFPSIALCSEESYLELEYIVKVCRNAIWKKYKKTCILFEHGSSSDICNSANSVDHVHLHIVPSNVDLIDSMSKNGAYVIKLENYKELKKQFNNAPKSYLFYENANMKKFYTDYNSDIFSSQYFRKVLVDKMNLKVDWNWHNCECQNLFLQTYNDLINIIKKYKFK